MGLAVVLGLYQALRREEIASLRWDAFEDGRLKVTGKGDKTARIPIHPVVAELLIQHPRHSPFLFPGRFGDHVTPATIWEWARKVGREAGVPMPVRPHELRHTCLATANDRTGDLRAVQSFARHTKPQTTAGYTRASKRRLDAVVQAIDYDDG